MDLLVEINLARYGLNELFETKGSYQKIGLGDILLEMATTVSSSVSSFNGRIGAVVPQVGDYTTDLVSEGITNLYYTTARAQSDALLVGANRALSNLSSPTSINQSLLFSSDGVSNIGQSADNRPNQVFIKTGLEIGSDTNLYRNSANVLKTDSSLIVGGDLNVNGTLTYLNTVNLEVSDANLIINKNGNDVSAVGAGITVDRTSTQGSLIFDPSVTSNWKAGLVGSEYQILTTANTTSDLTEGTNLYYTTARAQSDALLVGANRALSNLSSVAINTSLLFGADGIDDVGAVATSRPANIYAKTSVNSAGSMSVGTTLNMTGTSGANLLWNTDASGDIGATTANRPNAINAKNYVRTTIYSAKFYLNQSISNAAFQFISGRGTETSPLQSLANDTLGIIKWYGTTPTGSRQISGIYTQILENCTSSTAGGRIVFQTCALGDSALLETVSMATSGINFGAGLFFTSETYDIGKVSSNRPNNVYIKNNLEVGNDIILKGASNTDLLWDTDGTGSIGVAGNYRPYEVHVVNSVVIGSDTNLYREAANSLKTDSSLVIGGGLSIKRTSTSTNKTLTASECYLGVDTTNLVVVTLPLASAVNDGKIYIIKDETSNAFVNNIRIQVQGADKIDGGSYFDIITNSESITMVGDGISNWYII